MEKKKKYFHLALLFKFSTASITLSRQRSPMRFDKNEQLEKQSWRSVQNHYSTILSQKYIPFSMFQYCLEFIKYFFKKDLKYIELF